jgi:hypothetical protein
MEKNDNDLVKTQFDGKTAFVIGDHPHRGAFAICLGADTTHAGPGLVFENINTKERFFVFKPNHIEWRNF